MSNSGSFMPGLFSSLWQCCLQDLGAGIVVLVDAVAEAHQPVRGVLVLGPLDELGAVAALVADPLEHV